jgi:hypothetical protein
MTGTQQIAVLGPIVTRATTVMDGALKVINGIKAAQDAAVTAALANGATAEQLQPLTDLGVTLDAKATELAAAVEANTAPAGS